VSFDPGHAATAARLKRETGGDAPSSVLAVCQKIRAALMQLQRDFIDDLEQFKSLLCPRRAGKTVAAAAYLILTCLEKPGAQCVFGTMTLKRAWQLIVNGKDGLRKWNKKYSLGLHFNSQQHVITFPNESKVFVMGFETDGDVDKVRGEPFDLIILDECKSFPVPLFRILIEDAIEPTLLDEAGVLVIMGTPGDPRLKGPFWEATSTEGCTPHREDDAEPDEPWSATARPYWQRQDASWEGVEFEWSFHKWSIKDNTAHKVKNRRTGTVSTLWEEALRLQRRKKWTDKTPTWRREYLGEWIADDSATVSTYTDEQNGWTPADKVPARWHLSLPKGHDWHFGLGADMGFDNYFAIQVFAWCSDLITSAELRACGVVLTDKQASDIDAKGGQACFFQVYEFAERGLTIGPIVGAIQHARDVIGHDFDFMIADRGGQAKTILATIEEEYGISLDAADKHERTAHIEVWNSDLSERRCFIVKGSRLAGECLALTWKLPKGVFDRHRSDDAPLIRKYTTDECAQDNFDAGLYCVTKAQHRFPTRQPRAAMPGSQEWKRQELARKWAEQEARLKPLDPEPDGFGSDMAIDGYGEFGEADTT
jgi:hypothetical protein